MKRRLYALVLGAGLFFLSSCTRSAIEKAVRGDLLPTEANLAVTNHCQGCHVHVGFRGDPHMERVRGLYPQEHPLREANACLQCHVLRLETMFRDEARRTERPHGKLVDMANIPRPSPKKRLRREAQEAAAKKPGEEKKKKRRWYFFYLF